MYSPLTFREIIIGFQFLLTDGMHNQKYHWINKYFDIFLPGFGGKVQEGNHQITIEKFGPYYEYSFEFYINDLSKKDIITF